MLRRAAARGTRYRQQLGTARDISVAATAGWAAGAGAAAVGALQWNYAPSGDRLLRRTDSVLVVGGGIAGVATARELARAGYAVRLVDERHGPGEGCSGGNAGTLGVSAPSRRLSTPPFLLTAPAWLARGPTAEGPPALNKFCHRSTFLDPGFWLWGLSYLRLLAAHRRDAKPFQDEWLRRLSEERVALATAAEEEGLEAFEVTGRLVPVFGAPIAGSYASAAVGSKDLTPRGCLDYEPSLEGAVRQGLLSGGHWFEVDGMGDCRTYLQRLVRVLREKYRVRCDFGAACVELLVAGGRCRGARLQSGERVWADHVVLANGSGAAPLAASAGVYVPVQALRGYSFTIPVRTGGGAPPPRGCMVTQPHEMYISRMTDPDLGDCVRFAAYGELSANWLTQPSPVMLQRLEKLVRHCFPKVDEMVDWPRRREWVGARPLSPDSNPLVGPTRVPGLVVNAGHSFNGWRVGTLTGVLVANGMARGWERNRRYDLLFSPQRLLPRRLPPRPEHASLPSVGELRLPPRPRAA
eukprot:TRINITY_DN60555_c0_g1_i1.p1 TRINITY_DN60555_c0_g1~~TRINITY_DN60555_c0_g1_i1.p1  ORF type:complete len:524 (+),score=165.55 TRINITY_DN60555_c0_g1_i1:79-1650(+)